MLEMGGDGEEGRGEGRGEGRREVSVNMHCQHSSVVVVVVGVPTEGA